MIYTVTLNPALDRTIYVETLKPFDANRIRHEERYAGGKGIDVSRALKELNAESIALGFIGGFAGREMEGRLLNEGIATDFTVITGETRVNVIIHDIGRSLETSMLAQGPEVQPFEIVKLMEKVENLEKPEFVVVSGSLPLGVNPEIYRKILDISARKGARTVLDTDGPAFVTGLKAKPAVVKPNVFELSRYAGEEITTQEQILRWADKLRESGVEIVLVSMAADGIIMVSDRLRLHARPPKVDVKSTIGAGDSAVAGFVYGLHRGLELAECLRWSVAAGSAATMCVGSGVCRWNDTEQLAKQVEVKSLQG
jgi:6-phosphofructokinase 2